MSVSQLQVPLHALEHIQSTSLLEFIIMSNINSLFWFGWQNSSSGKLKIKHTFYFRILNPCCNPTFLGSATTATTSTAEFNLQQFVLVHPTANLQPARSSSSHRRPRGQQGEHLLRAYWHQGCPLVHTDANYCIWPGSCPLKQWVLFFFNLSSIFMLEKLCHAYLIIEGHHSLPSYAYSVSTVSLTKSLRLNSSAAERILISCF